MSGGAKKKSNRSEGWEEAGVEFYQESYPSNTSDIDVLQHNPKHLTTLLPSKQSRSVAATIRMRQTTSDTKTFRRHPTMRRDATTIRRQSMSNDVQISMMPDLSEFSANEKTTWLEMMEIKAMPIPMAQKKEMRAKLQVGSCLRLQGYEQFTWRRKQFWEKAKTRAGELYEKLELWRGTLKTIEGNFGTGVLSYFIFIKWLMFLNTATFALIFLAIILPTILMSPTLSDNPCTAKYFNATRKTNWILDIFQGTGEMERTMFFYGYYPNVTLDYSTFMSYNVPLAYVAITIACAFIALLAIVRSAAAGFRQRLIEGEGNMYVYCNMVFCSWDFCVDNARSSTKKRDVIGREMKATLASERLEEERRSRTTNEKTKVIVMRILLHVLMTTILGAALLLIYIVFEFATIELHRLHDASSFVGVLLEFLPSIVIVLLNMIVPIVFNVLSRFENYAAAYAVRLSMIRTIVLRLASLLILYFSIYMKVSCVRKANECASAECSTPQCWETFVGQQLYKLVLTDFATHLLMTFAVNFPRSRIGKIENRCAKLLGEQTFELPKHVLDVIYLQTVCWFGTFYAPLLPAMITVILACMFHIKKFVCLVNSQPSLTLYRVSRSNSMFMVVLLVSFAFAIIPLTFSISELQPSKACGPFRGDDALPTAWSIVTHTFHALPTFVQNVLHFMTTSAFALPLLIILLLCLYYYTAVTAANRHMVLVLKNQLVLEGHDKQFLLEKLSAFIRQHQKRSRQNEMLLAKDERHAASN